MNKEYLQNVHSSLGSKIDFDTWAGKIKNNDNYLSKLHGELGVTHDFNTWKQKVIGESVPTVPTEYKPEKTDYSQWQVVEEVDGVPTSLFKDPESL